MYDGGVRLCVAAVEGCQRRTAREGCRVNLRHRVFRGNESRNCNRAAGLQSRGVVTSGGAVKRQPPGSSQRAENERNGREDETQN
jgi:hypothetical protein